MTIKPIYKTCPICLRQYSWNPDIGQMWCPNCGKKGIPGINESKRSNPCTYKYSEKFAITVIIQLHKLYDYNELYNSYNYYKFFRRL